MNARWPLVPLGSLFDIGAGKTMSAAARDGKRKTPFLRTSNVLWDEVDLSTIDSMMIPEQELQAKLLRPGDLLVCEGGEIGRAAVWAGGVDLMSFQNHLHRLRRLSDNVEPRFYVYFLQSAFTQLGIFEGAGNETTIPNLSRNRLGALDVPLPALEEQQQIAGALAHVRCAMRRQAECVELSENLKAAAMRDLFTCGLRGDERKETEIGSVPTTWVQVAISSLGRIVTGNTPPTKDAENYVGGSIPFVAPGDIEHGTAITVTEKFITARGLASSRAIPSGSTCFVCIGSTIGKVGHVTSPVCATNQQINTVVPNGSFDPLYVYYLLTHWAEHVSRHASPSPVPILSKGVFEKVQLFVSTDKDEQREIGAILDAIDQKIDLHRRKRAVLDDLFKALLHKLMTGEIHVADLDLSALAQTEATQPAP